MNNDLISRSALLGVIDAAFFATDPTGEEQLGFLKCRRFAREAPTIDAEPVRRGRWIKLDFCPEWYKCSECECGWEIGMVVGCNINYCPNCGAKMMDGDADA